MYSHSILILHSPRLINDFYDKLRVYSFRYTFGDMLKLVILKKSKNYFFAGKLRVVKLLKLNISKYSQNEPRLR